MTLKRLAKLDGCHSQTVKREYKSRYLLESRHWDLSSDTISFFHWHVKGYFILRSILQNKTTSFRVNTLWPITNHTISHWLGPIFTRFCHFNRHIFSNIHVSAMYSLYFLSHWDLCIFYIKSSTWHHISTFWLFLNPKKWCRSCVHPCI